MKYPSSKGFKESQRGHVSAFGIMIIIMLFITIYELGVIYADWNKIKMISLNIRVLNEQRLPVSDVSLTINDNFAGFTNMEGKVVALIPKPGDVRISVKKKPFDEIDTTMTVGEDGLDVNFTMNRPYSTLTIVAVGETGEPLKDVGIVAEGKTLGQTGEDGSLIVSKSLYIDDTVDVKLSKSGYDDLSENIFLVDISHVDSFTMVKRAAPAGPVRPATTAPPKPRDDFQTYVNRASNYLDRAISGDSKYFGKALNEIDKAIRARPRSIPAKQQKVEILYNFAKSLRNSKLPYEAVNRLAEALKMYKDMPQDPLYWQVDELKREIERELGK